MIARKPKKIVRLGIKSKKKIDFKNLLYQKIVELMVEASRRRIAFIEHIYKATRRSPHPHFFSSLLPSFSKIASSNSSPPPSLSFSLFLSLSLSL